MTPIAQGLSQTCVAAGIVVLGLCSWRRQWLTGLRAALELWLAAGLLRLSEAIGWSGVLVTAAVVMVRVVLSRFDLPKR